TAILTPIIYGIVITFNLISKYPVEGSKNFCSGDLAPIFPIVWAFMGHNWLSGASNCQVNDPALYKVIYKTWILICIGCVMDLTIWVGVCDTYYGIWSYTLCDSHKKLQQ
ncbi:6969_t:CDS:2, partial [Ambispora gerdemannii]